MEGIWEAVAVWGNAIPGFGLGFVIGLVLGVIGTIVMFLVGDR